MMFLYFTLYCGCTYIAFHVDAVMQCQFAVQAPVRADAFVYSGPQLSQ